MVTANGDEESLVFRSTLIFNIKFYGQTISEPLCFGVLFMIKKGFIIDINRIILFSCGSKSFIDLQPIADVVVERFVLCIFSSLTPKRHHQLQVCGVLHLSPQTPSTGLPHPSSNKQCSECATATTTATTNIAIKTLDSSRNQWPGSQTGVYPKKRSGRE